VSPSTKTAPDSGQKTVASNRKARHDYDILETVEAGIVLTGTEVKSLRGGRAQMRDAFATVKNGRVTLHGVHIPPFEHGSHWNHEPERPRTLLLHRVEVDKLGSRVDQGGLTLVPLRIYFTHGLAKVEVALAKGRRKYDKRQALKEREHDLEMKRALRYEGRR
jgi:SsrA-binding protein